MSPAVSVFSARGFAVSLRPLYSILLLTTVGVLQVGCAGSPGTGTFDPQPGSFVIGDRPQMEFPGANRAEVQALAMGSARSRAWIIAESSDGRLVVRRPLDAELVSRSRPRAGCGRSRQPCRGHIALSRRPQRRQGGVGLGCRLHGTRRTTDPHRHDRNLSPVVGGIASLPSCVLVAQSRPGRTSGAPDRRSASRRHGRLRQPGSLGYRVGRHWLNPASDGLERRSGTGRGGGSADTGPSSSSSDSRLERTRAGGACGADHTGRRRRHDARPGAAPARRQSRTHCRHQAGAEKHPARCDHATDVAPGAALLTAS